MKGWSLKKTQQETIKHWRKMINWAKKQNPKNKPNNSNMTKAIGEDWYGMYCPYCISFIGIDMQEIESTCGNCPLTHDGTADDCCGGRWMLASNALTWREWIEFAEDVVSYVKRHGLEVYARKRKVLR